MSPTPTRAPARWCGLFASALLASGCAASRAVAPPTAPPPLGLGIVRQGVGAGPDLALIPRPSGELLQLSLWIDAGSRDAEAPQVATLAAWLAAATAGPDVHGEAWPDGTELSMSCARSQLNACVGQLARGLALRAPTSAAVRDVGQQLAQTQRLAAARDRGRDADRLALRALYSDDDGKSADAFFPLGPAGLPGAEADAQVRSFLTEHFGPGRALVIAAGELDATALEAAAATAFANAPAATAKRADARKITSADARVHVGVADADTFSVALAASDVTRVHAAAAAMQGLLERSGLRSHVHGNVFPVRGGALALLRVQARATASLLRALGCEYERLVREGPSPVAAQASGADLGALARRLGMRWTTRTTAQDPAAPLAMGIGVLVRGGRADHPALADPDAPLREHVQTELDTALRAGLALGEPNLQGPVDASTASVSLDNGANIEVRQRAGEQIAVALRFSPGAAADAPLQHGRAALLATLTTTACAGMQEGELRTRLAALGAVLEPEVSAGSWGLLLTAPGERWQEAVALTVECALHPTLDRTTLNAARLRLLQRLGPKDGPAALLAAAAEALWPASPGTVAPWGSRSRQASVSLNALRDLDRTSHRAGATHLAVVGPVPVEQAVHFGARRLATLEPLPRDTATPTADKPGGADPEEPFRQATLGLVWVRISMPGGHPAGARAFAALLRAALSQLPAISSPWQDGGLVADTGWAAVALVGAPEALAAVEPALPGVVSSLSEASLQRAADEAFELATAAQTSRAAAPQTEARALASGERATAAAPQLREAARALAKHLARETPNWVPMRE